MAMCSVPEIALSSGQKMPVLGLGTASSPPVAAEVVVQAMLQAIELGYRHFDTASVYKTESTLGAAIEEALRLGLVKSRAELFITSKLWCSDSHAEHVLPALRNTLRNLKTEYLLFLIHWPLSSMRPGTYEYPLKAEEVVPMDFKSVWAAMEECQRQGLTKSIGVSNFSSKKLGDILAFATIPPAVNQVELNPYWQQKKLRDYCKANGIIVAAFSLFWSSLEPFGALASYGVRGPKSNCKVHRKTVAQVCPRWEHEQEVAIVAKSYNKERMKQNLEIFDWDLSEEECEKIGEIAQSRVHRGEEFIFVNGPFKMVEELGMEIFDHVLLLTRSLYF